MSESLGTSIELHDSVIGSIALAEGAAYVAFRPAYIHRSAGEPGVDAGSGFIQELMLEFPSARIDGDIGDLPAAIFSGEFHVESRMFPNTISLPCKIEGAVSLVLFLSPDNRKIAISGCGVKARVDGEAVYIDEFLP